MGTWGVVAVGREAEARGWGGGCLVEWMWLSRTALERLLLLSLLLIQE